MYRTILLEPEYPENIGLVARLVENFDVGEYCLVNPRCEVREGLPAASRAGKTLKTARIVDRLETVVGDLDVLVGTTGIDGNGENFLRNCLTPEEAAGKLDKCTRAGILFGRESTGLSNEELDLCDFVVRIGASEDYPVLNISHAAAIILHAVSTYGNDKRTEGSSRREREVLENLFKDITETVDSERSRREKSMRAFRNVLGKSRPTSKEVGSLIGVLKKIRDRVE